MTARSPAPETPSEISATSQPCIRLDDLDSVGRSGRHLTTFEMMAHHVFNTREKEIYWKDRTVRLCDELLAGLGMDPLAVTYKENPWAGGGNAGPSVEVMVGGLELATLVFMDLKAVAGGPIQIKGEAYEKMNNYIVDTGYGLERFVWASTGSPTIYDAIFPDLVRKVADLAGVEHDLQDPEYAEIFAQNLYLQGHIAYRDYQTYRQLYETTMRFLPPPDLVVYLRASVPTLLRRIASEHEARLAQCEQKI